MVKSNLVFVVTDNLWLEMLGCDLAFKWTQRIVVIVCKASYLDAALRVMANWIGNVGRRLASLIMYVA
jgi:hypothetical protein